MPLVGLVNQHTPAQLSVSSHGSMALLLALGCSGVGLGLVLWFLEIPHLLAPLDQFDTSAYDSGKANPPPPPFVLI